MKRPSKRIIYVSLSLIIIALLVLLIYKFTLLNVEKTYYDKLGIKHPTPELCENMSKPTDKNFCLADLAEIQNDFNLCKNINDDDIKNLCTAQTTLNEEKCPLINDTALMNACYQSLQMKRQWANKSNIGS